VLGLATLAKAKYLLITYTAKLKDPNQDFKLASDEVAEVRWVRRNELNDLEIFDNCRRALEHYFMRN